MDWVKQPGTVAELLYIQRRAPSSMGSGMDGPTGSKKQHVAFPGGRMEPGDEGEMYTGEPEPVSPQSYNMLITLILIQRCERLGRNWGSTLLNVIGSPLDRWTTVRLQLHWANGYSWYESRIFLKSVMSTYPSSRLRRFSVHSSSSAPHPTQSNQSLQKLHTTHSIHPLLPY